MRPANWSATVFQTNAAYGALSSASRDDGRATRIERRERPLGRRREVGKRSRRAAAGCRCSEALTRTPAGRSSAQRRALESRQQLFLRQRARVEELLHQLLVGLGHHFDERLARGGGRLRHVPREPRPRSSCPAPSPRSGTPSSPRGRPRPRTPALRRSAAASGMMVRAHAWRSDSSVRSSDARSRSSRFSTTNRGSPSSCAAAQAFSVCTSTPATASTTTRAASATRSAALGLGKEVAEAGRIDEVDFRACSTRRTPARGERVFAGDFFVVVVGDGGAVVHLAEPVDHAGVEEHGRHQLCLAASPVTDDGHVADAGGVVDLHGAILPWGRDKAVTRASYRTLAFGAYLDSASLGLGRCTASLGLASLARTRFARWDSLRSLGLASLARTRYRSLGLPSVARTRYRSLGLPSVAGIPARPKAES